MKDKLTRVGFKQDFDAIKLCRLSYDGGLNYISNNPPAKHVRESSEQFISRNKRAYFYNYCQPVVDTYQFYLFKSQVSRTVMSNNADVLSFIDDCTRNSMSIDEFFKNALKELLLTGNFWIAVDNIDIAVDDVTVAQAAELGVRPYIYSIPTENVLDFGEDEFGNLSWIKYVIRESTKISFDYEGEGFVERYVVFSKDLYQIYDKEGLLLKQAPNKLGVVPVVRIQLPKGKPFIEDIAIVNRSIFNWCSLLDEIIYNQTFSILMYPGDLSSLKDSKIGTGQAVTFDPKVSTPPYYIHPDAEQARVLMEWIEKAILEIARLANLNWGSNQLPNTSGVAKAYDFMTIAKNLAALSYLLNEAENKVFKIFKLYYKDNKDYECTVQYPKDFSFVSLYERLDMIFTVLSQGISERFNELVKKQVVETILPNLTPSDKKVIFKEIEDTSDEEDMAMRMAQGNLFNSINQSSTTEESPKNKIGLDGKSEFEKDKREKKVAENKINK